MIKQPIIWKPHPGPQTEALKRTEFEILYGGARGGGKTDAGMAWLLRHINNSSYRALIIRKNYDDLSDWIDRAKQMYRGTGATFTGKPVEIRFPRGALFRAGHLKDPSSYEKYLGQEYQRMVLEELTLIPQEELYNKLIFSCRSTIDVKPQVFCTTNPGGPGHSWVKERFIDIVPWGTPYTYSGQIEDPASGKKTTISRSRVFIHAKVEDNPTLIESDPGYVLMLDKLKETNIGLYRAWRFGDWDIPAGQVFSEFRRDTHVIKPFDIPSDWHKWLAYDYGVNEPFSIGFYAENHDARIYLVDELYMNGQKFQEKFGVPFSVARLAKILKAKIKKMGWNDYQFMVTDPNFWNKSMFGKISDEGIEGESGAEVMDKAGLRLLKGDNNRTNGMIRYREALSQAPDGKPWYQMFANCRDSIRTIPSLVYDIAKGKIEDVDTNGEDHCYDRDRYFFMSRPAKPEHAPESKTTMQKAKDMAVRRRDRGYGYQEGLVSEYG